MGEWQESMAHVERDMRASYRKPKSSKRKRKNRARKDRTTTIMGSDLHMNPPTVRTYYEWREDELCLIIRVDGQPAEVMKRLKNPSDEQLAALDVFVKVPPRPERVQVTPTEWVIMELLQARILRLGEPFWYVPTGLHAALRSLEYDKKLIHAQRHGDGVYRVSLTKKGESAVWGI